MKTKIRIGTRGSKLALKQAQDVREALKAVWPDIETEVIVIKTSGDWTPAQGERVLADFGGDKGLFAREIEQALLAGEIDAGVHSAKDMPSVLPKGLVMNHYLPREDVRDAFLANGCTSLDQLPKGAVVGTSSVRRQAQVKAERPDLKTVPLRGNVPTRIEKLRMGQVDAAILAVAGLKRLGLEHEIASIMEAETMLPCAGQGAIGIEIREDDADAAGLFSGVSCAQTGLCVTAERAALQVLDGSCHTPIGALAEIKSGIMLLRVMVAAPDGTEIFFESGEDMVSAPAGAASLGRRVALALKPQVPRRFLAS